MDVCFTVDHRRHGKGPIIFAWHPDGTFLASTGTSRVVQVFTKDGEPVHQIVPPSPSICTALEWDKDGETLAVMQAQSAVVVLWNLSTKTEHYLDMSNKDKDLTFMKWSKVSSHLAIGTGKGNLVIYDKATDVKTIAAGKNSKRRILCGDWNKDNKLAYASEDKQITICTVDGFVIDQVKVKSKPLSVTFGGRQADNENIVSVNMEGRTILLYSLLERDNSLELAFQPRYGGIVSYQWFGDGSIIAGFSSGFVVVISTHFNEIGREQFSHKFHQDALKDVALSPSVQKVATCGDNCIKLIDMEGWKEVDCEFLEKDAQLDKVSWSARGNVLSVSTLDGCLYTFEVQSSNHNILSTRIPHHSFLSLTLKPFLPLRMLLVAAVVLMIALFFGIYYLSTRPLDLLRAVTGFSEAI